MANPDKHPLKIAILGTRGIPARYGGFETFAEELSTRLVKRGHRVTVYCRHSLGVKANTNIEYQGVSLRSKPTIMHKYFETPVHAFFSFVDLFFFSFDVVLLCNAANSPFAWFAQIKGVPIAINVDGIERKRAKWNMAGRLWYLLGERCSVWFASKVIADAKVIADYYSQTYKHTATVIAYGATAIRQPPGPVLKKFALTAKNYLLYVSRLEPENNALGVIQAYNKLKTLMPLVIVGDAPYAKDYLKQLKSVASNQVVFTGYQFAEAYQELQSNCYLYIQATEVGGTHPALIESMAYGNCVIANGTPENREVLSDCGLLYETNNFDKLSELLGNMIASPELVGTYGSKAQERAKNVYNWEKITDQYEELFLGMKK